MNTETTFTASSGHRCTYEIVIEDGRASANIVWLGQPPTPEDIRELEQFLTQQADDAQFPHAGTENILLGQIQLEDLPRIREIVAERKRSLGAEEG